MNERSPFYVALAGAVILVTFVGFAPTYYLKAFFDTPTLSLLHHFHGVVATLFVLAFLGQALLVYTGRTRLHMQAGRFAAAAGVLTAVSMGILAFRSVAARNEVVGATEAFQAISVRFFLGDMLMLVLFSLFIGLGLISRRRPAFHKRFMLLALLSLMPPTIGRIASFGPKDTPHPAIMLPIFLSLLAAPLVYEVFVRGRPHPVFAVGAPAIFLAALSGAFLLPQIGFLRDLVLRL